jgi:hypothetical protein
VPLEGPLEYRAKTTNQTVSPPPPVLWGSDWKFQSDLARNGPPGHARNAGLSGDRARNNAR